MATKSSLRVILTTRWMRWAVVRSMCLLAPPLGRRLSFPTRGVAATSVASEVLEKSVERLSLDLTPEDLARAQSSILQPARENDRGDTSTYVEGYTLLATEISLVKDCVIAGRTLSVMRARDMALVQREDATPNHNQAKPLSPRDRVAEPGAHVALSCNGNYFHFHSNDLLPIARMLRLYGERLGRVWIVARDNFPAFVFEGLEALGKRYPSVGVVRLGAKERLIGLDALYQSRLGETGWLATTRAEASDLRDMLLASPPRSTRASRAERIFVSRGEARLRRLKNEKELVAALEGRGYGVVIPGGLDQQAQVETFMAARFIIAVHGAALTNLLFCEPGATVIELFPADRVKSAYFWLATRMGLKYHAVVGSRGDHWEGFSVDVADVLAVA